MRTLFRQFRDTVAAAARRRKRPNDEGVTLVEMIVVLVIIAVIAGMIVSTGILSRPDQARVTTTTTDMRTISAALKMYRLDNGDYPTTAQGLKALAEKPTTAPIPSNWNPEGYVGQPPKDAWGRDYVYVSPAPGGFSLKSLGKDGAEGGEGLDADIVAGR
ncbi:type II secretion system major pseudopilin GspG [uncultured Sphingomonas sp.]|uniref:type II secretion system major pseudopilin GspG n=1 Tax=uncultured Sphingomonas sp. TaxID=158754 RepID=UPI0025CC294B|nr:type II secretion system major pseudopilin GspG [uncultured Sphingomonas sp.]